MYTTGQVVEAQELVSEQVSKQSFEAVVIFKDEEFLFYDFQKQSWQLGDFVNTSNLVSENAAVVALEPIMTLEF